MCSSDLGVHDLAVTEVDGGVVDVAKVGPVPVGGLLANPLLGEEQDVPGLVAIPRVQPQVAVGVEPARQTVGVQLLVLLDRLAELDPAAHPGVLIGHVGRVLVVPVGHHHADEGGARHRVRRAHRAVDVLPEC